ncbi:MAG: MmcB family DNA repair protein [Pseudomonadota bacterium]
MTESNSRPDITAEVTRGAARLCLDLGFAPIFEFTLKTGRRADICAIGPKGEIIIIEVKSSIEDFKSDNKWHEYAEYCDKFYFAMALGFPLDLLPEGTGIIIADEFGAQILREPQTTTILNAARRKVVTLSFARHAAMRGIVT